MLSAALNYCENIPAFVPEKCKSLRMDSPDSSAVQSIPVGCDRLLPAIPAPYPHYKDRQNHAENIHTGKLRMAVFEIQKNGIILPN